MTLLQSGLAKSLAEDYTIDNSLRFDDGATPYMSWAPSAANSVRTKWTISAWVKLGNIGVQRDIFSAGDGAAKEFALSIGTNYKLSVYNYTSGVYNFSCNTDALLRDPSAWYHILCRYDSTDGTTNDRVQLFINGERQSLDTNTQPSSSFAADFWSYNGEHFISSYPLSRTNYMDGYLAEVYSIDGTAYTASDFGELDSTTNQWKPIDASGLTFGTNGFYQKYNSTELAASFADSSHIWTCPAGVTTVDYLVVGGGGGGGDTRGGGGGAGGMLSGTGFSVTAGTEYTITVGAGGAGSAQSIDPGASGGNSVFSTLTAIGGGGGAGSADGGQATNGGSGGGGTQDYPPSHGTGTAGQGNNGGTGAGASNYGAGGGGGKGAVGTNGTTTVGGNGGVGESNSITGSAVFYAGGGGGGTYTSSTPGSGGNGGGGDGKWDAVGGAGTANTGGGGGGGGHNGLVGFDGGAGGSGIVIIDDGTTVTSFTGSAHTITANGDVTNTRAVRKVGDSSIDFDGTGDYLSIPDSSDWDLYETTATTFTYESWIKFTSTPSGSTEVPAFIAQWEDDDNKWQLGMTTGEIQFYLRSGGSTIFSVSGGTITDTNWHHVAWVKNGTSLRTFVDGVLALDTTTSDTGTLSGGLYIGTIHGAAQFFDGYMTEIRVSDVARYTATFTTFGQDGGTISNPTEFTADSNTKLLIHSNWDGGLGADSSGNYNTFTPTNLVATDQMIDTPTNNFCTWNPLNSNSNITFTEGNLGASSTSAGYASTEGTIAFPTSGKWYYEQLQTSATALGGGVGAIDLAISRDSTATTTGTYIYGEDGTIYINGTTHSSAGASFAAGDITATAVDLGNSKIYFYKNNVVQGDASGYTIGADQELVPWSIWWNVSTITNFGSDSSFAANKTAQGNQDSNSKGDFYYTPPTDYLALCTDNLSAPEIALPGENFNTVLYAGDDGSDRAITVGMQPDLVWFKARNAARYHALIDSVRGGTKIISSNDTAAEATTTGGITSFDSTGFDVSHDTNWNSLNNSGDNIVTWNWKAGGAPTATNSAGAGATPTAGSVKIDGSNLGSALSGTIPATKLSANTTSGFSIITWEGTGAIGTVAHGLSVAPELVMVKNFDMINEWPVGSDKGMDFTDYLRLDGNRAMADDDRIWNDVAPSATVFTVGAHDSVNNSGDGSVAYCFHSVEGYSKVGSYTGNGNADGTFIYLGFRPSWAMIKRADSTSSWSIRDSVRAPYNVILPRLWADLTNAESTSSTEILDFTSNGIKTRANIGGINTSGGTYMYYAIAESPFKYSNAR